MYTLDFFLQKHPKLDAFVTRAFPLFRYWLEIRVDWVFMRTLNDPPDDAYLPWSEYWELCKREREVNNG